MKQTSLSRRCVTWSLTTIKQRMCHLLSCYLVSQTSIRLISSFKRDLITEERHRFLFRISYLRASRTGSLWAILGWSWRRAFDRTSTMPTFHCPPLSTFAFQWQLSWLSFNLKVGKSSQFFLLRPRIQFKSSRKSKSKLFMLNFSYLELKLTVSLWVHSRGKLRSAYHSTDRSELRNLMRYSAPIISNFHRSARSCTNTWAGGNFFWWVLSSSCHLNICTYRK